MQTLGITAVESRRHIFISRLNPDTTIDQLKQHLNSNNIQVVDLERLNTKSADIAAFRLQVPFSDMKKVFDPTMWPKYTILRPFSSPNASRINFTKQAP